MSSDMFTYLLFGFGLISYLIFSGYSMFMVYTGVLEENAHWITKTLYYLGIYSVLLWTSVFTSMLLVKLGKLLFS